MRIKADRKNYPARHRHTIVRFLEFLPKLRRATQTHNGTLFHLLLLIHLPYHPRRHFGHLCQVQPRSHRPPRVPGVRTRRRLDRAPPAGLVPFVLLATVELVVAVVIGRPLSRIDHWTGLPEGWSPAA